MSCRDHALAAAAKLAWAHTTMPSAKPAGTQPPPVPGLRHSRAEALRERPAKRAAARGLQKGREPTPPRGCLPSRRPGAARSRRVKGPEKSWPKRRGRSGAPWRGVIARSEVDGMAGSPPKRVLAKAPKMPSRWPSRRPAPPARSRRRQSPSGEDKTPRAQRSRTAGSTSENAPPQQHSQPRSARARVAQPPPGSRGRPALPAYQRAPTKPGARADLWITGAAVDN
jgi:hypothetical protein